MIKVVLIDADGVVVVKRVAPFSLRFSQDYKIPPEQVTEFFKNEYQLCAVGQADLRSEVGKYIKKWGWSGTVDDILEYWFSAERNLDQDVITIVSKLKTNKVKVYLASDNEKHRAKDLWENVGLKRNFDGSLFSCDMGVKKSNPNFFKKAISQTSALPSEILYIDDDEKNLAVAKDLGIHTHLFVSADKLWSFLTTKRVIIS